MLLRDERLREPDPPVGHVHRGQYASAVSVQGCVL